MERSFEQSYGVIPLKKEGVQWKVLLIRHQAGHWSFPKGHAEIGESPLDAASRELKEETGLTLVELLSDTPLTESYRFKSKNKRVEKTVSYFLAEVDGKLELQKEELADCKWVDVERASEVATFPESKRICHELLIRIGLRK